MSFLLLRHAISTPLRFDVGFRPIRIKIKRHASEHMSLLITPSCHLDSASLHLDAGFRPIRLKIKRHASEHKCSLACLFIFILA